MKLTLKFSTLTGLLCLLVPGLMWAGTVYTYTGNPYTDCTGTYVCTGTSPALSLTFDTPLTGTQLDNLLRRPDPRLQLFVHRWDRLVHHAGKRGLPRSNH